MAMHDVYDFFYDINKIRRGLLRVDDLWRPAIILTASMAKHASDRGGLPQKRRRGTRDLYRNAPKERA